jgi:hypothetical protein
MAATISGYAAVFNEETVIAGLFRERIQRGAFAATIRRDDIRAAFNYSPDHILGRTASACIGRPYVWGLAAFGQPGVEAVLDILRRELLMVMRQAGTRRIAEIDRSHLVS